MDLVTDISSSPIALKTIFALVIIALGIFVGKGVSYLMSKFGEKLDLDKKMRSSFWGLIVNLVRWSIYLVFLNWAINQMGVPNLTSALSKVLLVIPSFVVSILIVVIGFIIARYLKDISQESVDKENEFISKYLFYFVIFISGVYALKIALYNFDTNILNSLTIIFSIIFAMSIGIISSLRAIKN